MIWYVTDITVSDMIVVHSRSSSKSYFLGVQSSPTANGEDQQGKESVHVFVCHYKTKRKVGSLPTYHRTKRYLVADTLRRRVRLYFLNAAASQKEQQANRH